MIDWTALPPSSPFHPSTSSSPPSPFLSFIFAKTTESGLTSFYALYLDSIAQTALFEYRHEGLDEGFRVLTITGVALGDGTSHHLALLVFGDRLVLFVDGHVHREETLIAALEDGPGELFLGQRRDSSLRYEGMYCLCIRPLCSSYGLATVCKVSFHNGLVMVSELE